MDGMVPALDLAARLALAGAVTGVGFIGAGLVFRQNDTRLAVLHGVTTAATILAAPAIGAAAGYERP
jgi:putative Mg2+ transporter-C (MgtC) family protein